MVSIHPCLFRNTYKTQMERLPAASWYSLSLCGKKWERRGFGGQLLSKVSCDNRFEEVGGTLEFRPKGKFRLSTDHWSEIVTWPCQSGREIKSSHGHVEKNGRLSIRSLQVPMWERQGCQWIINIPSSNGKLQHKLHNVNILGDRIMDVC